LLAACDVAAAAAAAAAASDGDAGAQVVNARRIDVATSLQRGLRTTALRGLESAMFIAK